MDLDVVGSNPITRPNFAISWSPRLAPLIDPVFAADGRRIVKTTDDGLLLKFPNVIEAVGSAVAAQRLIGDRNGEIAARRFTRILQKVGAS